MPNIRKPRKGTMQYWHRRQAKKAYSRVRHWPDSSEVKLLGFAGYKVGMTHCMVTDNLPNSITKGEDLSIPLTVIECPAIKIAGINFYKKKIYGLTLSSCVLASNLDKVLKRKIILPKKIKQNVDDIEEFDDVRVLVYTQPSKTGIGKKKPDVFEIGIGGDKKEEKLDYAKSILGKEIAVKDILKEGHQLDSHSVTTGKGTQGAVKRFGIGLRSHRSEKGRRGPGSLGPWKAQGHVMWRVAHAGKTGYYNRLERNKWLIKIGEKPEEINPKGGFLNYGLVKNDYILIKGSVPGSVKRLIKLVFATRPNKSLIEESPNIQKISLESKQR